MEENTTTKPWYETWWAVTIFIIFGLTFIGPYFSNSTTNNSQNTPTQENKEIVAEVKTETSTQKEAPLEDRGTNEKKKVMDYEIIYELNDKRYDGGKSFYVLVDKIDVTTDAFQNDIKRIVDEMVKIKGGKIAIDFVTNREVLELVYKSHYGSNTLGRTLTKDETDKIGESLVAQFTGQSETEMYINTLNFFPAALRGNPKVGRYVESFEYNPSSSQNNK